MSRLRGPVVPCVAAAVVMTLASCSSDAGAEQAPSVGKTTAIVLVRTDETRVALHVEVADTDAERAEGLMGRTHLGPDEGMAFLWDEPVSASFWMKDTLLPLSAIFWDEHGRIVWTGEMTSCESDPCPTYGPEEEVVGAAEANAGWFSDRGVELGDQVALDGVP